MLMGEMGWECALSCNTNVLGYPFPICPKISPPLLSTGSLSYWLGTSSWRWLTTHDFSMVLLATPKVEEVVMMMMMMVLVLILPRGPVRGDDVIDDPAQKYRQISSFFFFFFFFFIYFLLFHFIWDIGLYLRTFLYFCFYFKTCTYLQ